jgi:predicted O-methyltransferase YrrM
LPFPASRVIRIAERFGLAQRASELARLFRLVRRRRPRTVLELGRAGGGTFFLWTRAASSRAVLVSVGLPPWEHDDLNGEARREAKATLGRPRQRIHVLAEDPLRASVRARVESLLGDWRLDFLFLTGEDDVDRVRDCLDLYVPLMRPGGLVALDGVRQRLGGTDRMPAFWREVRRRTRSRDLVEDESRPGFGIGVVWIGPRASPTWWRD